MFKRDYFFGKRSFFRVLAVLVVMAFASTGSSSNQPVENESSDQKNVGNSAKAKHREDRIIVKLKNTRVTENIRNALANQGLSIFRNLEKLEVLILKLTAKCPSVEAARNCLKGLPFVQYAEPDYMVELNATARDLIRRLDENTGPENFLRHLHQQKSDSRSWQFLAAHFRSSLIHRVFVWMSRQFDPRQSIGGC